MTKDYRRQRSFHCKPAEQMALRAAAEAAGLSVSRYVIGLALADDPERHPVALTPDEQAELRDRVAEVWHLVSAAKEAAEESGMTLPDAIRALAGRVPRNKPGAGSRNKPPGSGPPERVRGGQGQAGAGR
ncbi:MAG: hypothetical protein OXP07_18095 [Defluviicoccus sp.]|nr:hypothetical protein [Defluviicoccus sp.]